MANERLKDLLKINYKIDVPNDTFVIYFERNVNTNRKRRMLRWNYNGCSKNFKKAWNLFDHMRIHTGDKPFKCHLWDRGFAQNGNLTKHIKLHTNNDRKIHEWNICNKKYTERFNLRVSIDFTISDNSPSLFNSYLIGPYEETHLARKSIKSWIF